MTRRDFITIATSGVGSSVPAGSPLIVPVHHILDSRAKAKPERVKAFWSRIWPEAVSDLSRCGIQLPTTATDGEVRRSPSGQPLFVGLKRGVVNFVITNHIPLAWDKGRGLSGVTTQYQGYHLCMVALRFAHSHRIPLIAVNTCLHELLHILLQDVFEAKPQNAYGAAREFRVDLYATRLWLFHDGAAIRQSANSYVERLRSSI